jgi:hypothetical protein
MDKTITKLYYDLWDTAIKTPFDFELIQSSCKRINHLMNNIGKQHSKWNKLKCKIFGHLELESFHHYPDIDKDEYDIWYRCPRCGWK